MEYAARIRHLILPNHGAAASSDAATSDSSQLIHHCTERLTDGRKRDELYLSPEPFVQRRMKGAHQNYARCLDEMNHGECTGDISQRTLV